MTRPDLRLCWAAWGLWLLAFLVIAGDVVRHPLKHTTTPTYRLAVSQWWAGQDPYSLRNHDGFLYLPQAALLFTPFTWMPPLAGDLLWRLVVFGLFAYAVVRLYRFFLSRGDPAPDRTFLLLSLLAVPSALASLRNAQFDLPLAALLILAAAETTDSRWKMAAFWLCLGVALKPLAIVPLLLFGALKWRLIPRLVVGLFVVLALPFLNANPAFVAHEYVRCAQTLAWASQANEPRYSDLAALLAHGVIVPPDWVKTPARLFFALLFLGFGFGAVRRLDRVEAAWTVGALSAIYLMLFNPRTETCSYVFLGPFVASLALWEARRAERRWLSWVLGFAALGLACDAVPHLLVYTDRWLKPLIALLFLPVVVWRIFWEEKALEISHKQQARVPYDVSK
jgi:Glycosyltransferase family 87